MNALEALKYAKENNINLRPKGDKYEYISAENIYKVIEANCLIPGNYLKEESYEALKFLRHLLDEWEVEGQKINPCPNCNNENIEPRSTLSGSQFIVCPNIACGILLEAHFDIPKETFIKYWNAMGEVK